MLKAHSRFLIESDATLFKVDYSLNGELKREFVYRYDLVDRMDYLETASAKILNLRKEE